MASPPVEVHEILMPVEPAPAKKHEATLGQKESCATDGPQNELAAAGQNLKGKTSSIKNIGEARNIIKLEAAIEAIDTEDINLTPSKCLPRVPDRDGPFRSCVRAMIARLIKYGEEKWTFDSFRMALDRITLLNFIEERGPVGSKPKWPY
ncbi:uncharacterized protein LTR77_010139 [Saxophila tyrrhenica]|uniref:Uncharacterized protein n=1 Tax=Saxophila tyrrhenica TaxID=1690608 RepID=A0AAV9NWJ5_9PEZI|nr:hypothetical protein LTR77_010139 [Saxophila tyrrhenica]